jgi:acyl-CoA reductase-like NAD-dependent aldehyde dehydrogenase
LPSDDFVDAAVAKAVTAFQSYRRMPLQQRLEIVRKMLAAFEAESDDVGREITEEMGRPIRYGPGEVSGFLERANYLVSVAEKSLQDIAQTETDKPGFRRYLRKEPLGVLFLIVPWNVSGVIETCVV